MNHLQELLEIFDEEFAKLDPVQQDNLRRLGAVFVNAGVMAALCAIPGLNFTKVGLFTAVTELAAIKAELRKMNASG